VERVLYIVIAKDQTREKWSHVTTHIAFTSGFTLNAYISTHHLHQEPGTAQTAANSERGKEKELNKHDMYTYIMFECVCV